MRFARVFRFIGILTGIPLIILGFFIKFPEYSFGISPQIAQLLHITLDEGMMNGGLATLIMGGVLLALGTICLFISISDISFKRDMKIGGSHAEKGFGKYQRKYKKVVDRATKAAFDNYPYAFTYFITFTESPAYSCKFMIVIEGNCNGKSNILNGLPDKIQSQILTNLHASGKIKEAFSLKVKLSTTEYTYTR